MESGIYCFQIHIGFSETSEYTRNLVAQGILPAVHTTIFTVSAPGLWIWVVLVYLLDLCIDTSKLRVIIQAHVLYGEVNFLCELEVDHSPSVDLIRDWRRERQEARRAFRCLQNIR